MVEVKICGLTDPAALDAALAAGARYVGLVFFDKSPRRVSLEQAQALAERVRSRALVVAVTVNADDAQLAAIAARVRPDLIQLHGAESPARVAASRRFAPGVIKAMAIAEPADLAAVPDFAGVSDHFLFDAKPPAGAALPGGNGAAFDWRILAGFKPPRPWFLSGGLNAENVAAAASAASARAVDVSSGVESAPGVKDASKILAFMAAASGRSPSA